PQVAPTNPSTTAPHPAPHPSATNQTRSPAPTHAPGGPVTAACPKGAQHTRRSLMAKKTRTTTTSSSTNSSANGAATLTPTVKVMIVCVPDGLPGEALTNRALDTHFGVQGTLAPRFWATPSMWMWQRSQLVDPRKGRPVYCAGGPARLLDLDGMRQ